MLIAGLHKNCTVPETFLRVLEFIGLSMGLTGGYGIEPQRPESARRRTNGDCSGSFMSLAGMGYV